MHLGQTASFLAKVINRPEPTVQMVGRLLREGEWVKKGARGRNAPHISSRDLSNFLIALMCCPDSPAIAMERLPHFAGLPLDYEGQQRRTFSEGLSLLLEDMASKNWAKTKAKNWVVTVAIDLSSASMIASPADESEEFPEDHYFTSLIDAEADASAKDSTPFFGGLETTVALKCYTLFRIAKVVLAGTVDPLPEMSASYEGESGE